MDAEHSENTTHVDGRQPAPIRPEAEAFAVKIPIDKLAPNPEQPRTFFDELEHKWLTESVAKSGVIQPILVRPLDDGTYMIIAGERRYRAAQAAGLSHIPALVTTEEARPLDDVDVQELALMENLQRRGLNDFDLAVGVTEQLRKRLGLEDTQQVVRFLRRMYNETLRPEDQKLVEPAQAIFRVLGRNWKSFTTTQLNVFALHPELQKQLRLGKLDLSKARVLNRIADDETRNHLMWSAIANGWTRAQLRREIADLTKNRILEREDEVKRAQVASRMTELRRKYVKHRRLLPAASIEYIEETFAQLDAHLEEVLGQQAGEAKAV